MARPFAPLLRKASKLFAWPGEVVRGVLGAFTVAHGLLGGTLMPGVAPPKRTTAEIERAYDDLPVLHSVLRKVGEGFAASPWSMYQATPANARQARDIVRVVEREAAYDNRHEAVQELLKDGRLREIEEHPVLRMLTEGNRILIGSQVRSLTVKFLDAVGECAWLLDRGGLLRTPQEAFPIPSSWIVDPPSPSKGTYTICADGFRGEIPEDDVLFFRSASLGHPLRRGSGIAQALSDELDNDEAIARHMKTFFWNRAVPPVLLTPTNESFRQGEGLAKVEDAEIRATEANWRRKLNAAGLTMRTFFFRAPLQVHQLVSSFRDQAIPELRKQTRDFIIECWGIPKELFAILGDSNRSTISRADMLMKTYVLQPRLELVRETLQYRLLPQYPNAQGRVVLHYQLDIREDRDLQKQLARSIPWILEVDEARKLGGWGPLPDGQGRCHIVPPSHVRVGKLSEIPGPKTEGV